MPFLAAGIALALIAGIWLGDRLEPDPHRLRTIAFVLALSAPAVLRRPVARASLALALAGFAGAGSMATRLDSARAGWAPSLGEMTLEGRPCGAAPTGSGLVLCEAVPVLEPRRTPAESTPPGRFLLSTAAGSAEARALARVSGAPRIRARVRTRPLLGPRNPGARDLRRSLMRRGISARGYLVDADLVATIVPGSARRERNAWTDRGGAERLRHRVSARLRSVGEGGGLLAALAVGDRNGLTVETRRDFARLGIAHLLAVSGLHVAIVAALGYALGRRFLAASLTGHGVGDPRWAAAATAILAAFAYARMAGLGVPLQRALVVACVVGVAFVTGRAWPVGSVLAVAAVAVLVVDPGALFEAGAQLSFAAAGALMVAAPRLWGEVGLDAGRVSRLIEAARRSVRTSSVALAATAPILAAHGMGVSLLGLAINVVAVPLAGMVLLPAALIAAGLAAAAPRGLGAYGVAWSSLPADAALGLVRAGAALLPDGVPSALPGTAGLAVAVAVGCGAVALQRDVARVCAVLALGLWLGASPVTEGAPGSPRLVALDVGQGDALLVAGRRARMLVDGGRAIPGRVDMGARVVVPALAGLGVSFLDVVMVSHADVDHRGGLEAVLRSLQIGELWLPVGGGGDPAYASLRALAAARGVPVREVVAEGPPIRVGDLTLEVLWPPADLEPGPTNDRSIVARVSVEGDTLLLTGDASRAVEHRLLARGVDLSARVLKVAHHGSDTSSGPGFIDAVGPRIALVSAGCSASSGLPTRGVLDRLHAHGVRIAWTGRDGAITIPLGRRRSGAPFHAFAARRTDCEAAPVREPPVSCVAQPSACE